MIKLWCSQQGDGAIEYNVGERCGGQESVILWGPRRIKRPLEIHGEAF
jgi:hypothetical protein